MVDLYGGAAGGSPAIDAAVCTKKARSGCVDRDRLKLDLNPHPLKCAKGAATGRMARSWSLYGHGWHFHLNPAVSRPRLQDAAIGCGHSLFVVFGLRYLHG
jgi:hypothetical protein